jgi:hypothetical protein
MDLEVHRVRCLRNNRWGRVSVPDPQLPAPLNGRFLAFKEPEADIATAALIEEF